MLMMPIGRSLRLNKAKSSAEIFGVGDARREELIKEQSESILLFDESRQETGLGARHACDSEP